MTKIFITVDGDTRSRDGRNIRVKVITDNELVNIQLKAPFTWSKTFPRGTNMKDVRKDMVSNIKGIIRNTEIALDKDGIIGKEFTVEV